MPHPPLHVLLVEDDDGYASLLASEFDALPSPVRLRRVTSIHDAALALALGPVDAILLDLGLPDSAGVQTVERMHRAAPGVPIVVVTAHDDEEAALQAVQQGADDYLVKSSANAQAVTRSVRYARERFALRRALIEREEQLRQAHKMEAVGRLAGGVAHDFNNVLTAIFGYTDLLLDQFTDDDPRRADVQEIRRSAERAAALTRQLLAFSRKQVMQPRILDLHEVVVGVEQLLQRLVGDEVVVEVRSVPDLWPVRADPGHVEQVLMNLATNARDAMPRGGRLEIRMGNVEVAQVNAHDLPGLMPGQYACLEVSDSGSGIPDAIRPHIFEPFFTTKEQGRGTGLGLATVYGIVKQMNGGIYLDLLAKQGTRFRVYLPRVPGDRPTSAA